MIAHTQPRRLAARTVAERIAHELGVELGEAVGYAVRFSDRSGPDTLVRLMTDGLLLAEIRRDRSLRRYDTIIVDEAHERSLNIDFLLGHLARILPRRPDLKLIITSATIDPERFSRHFGGAPIVEVSGRTYPVEVRYSPLAGPDGSERDQTDAIGDAVEELLREPSGDVLVFLSGEREIRDTADALAARLRSDIDILPLYSRLSTREQQRVFRPHEGRRVVLATNVAETSLTVPGIRYVVDPGTARISRYSARLKVQRLPIEPVSQASADQRKGRCGRTSDGICVRLYAEEDFDGRPRFTDPEILRTNLASVLLQMAAAGLGDVEDFPFLDPPDRRQVRDGVRLLQELGRLRRRRAADAARAPAGAAARRPAPGADGARGRPARLRGGGDRDRGGALDPGPARAPGREARGGRPPPCPLRRRGVGLPRLREPLALRARAAARALGQPVPQALPRRVPAPPARARVAGPRRPAAPGGQGRRRCTLDASAAGRAGVDPHRAARRPALAPRHARPGAARLPGRARRALRALPGLGAGAQAAELGDGRRAGRDLAAVGADRGEDRPALGRAARRAPDQAQLRGAALGAQARLRRGDSSARRSTGCRSSPGARSPTGEIDPELSRSLFIRRALVEGDWDTRHAFFAANRQLLEEVEELEHRARRRDIVVSDQALYDFYDARIPPEVVSGAHFDRWWKDERRRAPGAARLHAARTSLADAADALDRRALPEAWRQGELTLPLSYVFDPGSERDGVTVHVPLELLPQLEPIGFDWLVPALRPELVTALIRSLPKDLRRPLVPVPEVAAAVLERLEPRSEPLLDALARELERLRGVRVPREAFDARPAAAAPAHALPRRGRARRARRRGRRPRRAARAGPPAAARGARRRRRAARAPRPARRGRSARCRRSSRCRAPARRCAAIRRWSTRATPSACACSRRPRRSARRCTRARAS